MYRRGKMLAKVREIIHDADPEILEEWKWMGTPIWSYGGIVDRRRTSLNAVSTLLLGRVFNTKIRFRTIEVPTIRLLILEFDQRPSHVV